MHHNFKGFQPCCPEMRLQFIEFTSWFSPALTEHPAQRVAALNAKHDMTIICSSHDNSQPITNANDTFPSICRGSLQLRRHRQQQPTRHPRQTGLLLCLPPPTEAICQQFLKQRPRETGSHPFSATSKLQAKEQHSGGGLQRLGSCMLAICTQVRTSHQNL